MGGDRKGNRGERQEGEQDIIREIEQIEQWNGFVPSANMDVTFFLE